MKPLIVAHRGASHVAPENTLAAFRQAAAEGAAAIEFDVAATADGELVLLHDEAVTRTTDGTGLLRDLTLAQVKALDAGRWKAPQYAGERIPTLPEALALAAELNLGVYIEWKPALRLSAADIVARTLAAVRRHGLEERTVVQSFAPELVAAAARVKAGWRVELLVFRPRGNAVSLLAELGATGYNPFHLFVTRALAARLHAAGYRLTAWTVNHPWTMRRLAPYCDAMITDKPRLLRDVIGQK